ncbi:hypothetical protein D3C84_881570 [compost metagenome]
MRQAVEQTDQRVVGDPEGLAVGHEVGEGHHHGEAEQELYGEQAQQVRWQRLDDGIVACGPDRRTRRVGRQRQHQQEGNQRQPGQVAIHLQPQPGARQHADQHRAAEQREAR